jgi:hypothetical protein
MAELGAAKQTKMFCLQLELFQTVLMVGKESTLNSKDLGAKLPKR